jgi:hypothetical protein
VAPDVNKNDSGGNGASADGDKKQELWPIPEDRTLNGEWGGQGPMATHGANQIQSVYGSIYIIYNIYMLQSPDLQASSQPRD